MWESELKWTVLSLMYLLYLGIEMDSYKLLNWPYLIVVIISHKITTTTTTTTMVIIYKDKMKF